MYFMDYVEKKSCSGYYKARKGTEPVCSSTLKALTQVNLKLNNIAVF